MTHGLCNQILDCAIAAQDAHAALSDYLLARHPEDQGWQALSEAIINAINPLVDSVTDESQQVQKH